MNMQEHPEKNSVRWFQSQTITWTLLGFLAIGAFFLIRGHPLDLLGILPFAIILLCPVMMLFMHHGHEGHAGHDQQRDHSEQNQQSGYGEHPSEGGHP